jgi:hypothetical protein
LEVQFGRDEAVVSGPGDLAKAAVELIWEGKVPTGALLGEVFALEDGGKRSTSWSARFRVETPSGSASASCEARELACPKGTDLEQY